VLKQEQLVEVEGQQVVAAVAVAVAMPYALAVVQQVPITQAPEATVDLVKY
jgi:hypothetical protein